jgi:hypothetical protein
MRIVKPRESLRAAYVSVFVACCAALVLFVTWRMWRGDEPLHAPIRELSKIEFTWKCPAGHVFRAWGQREPRGCMNCDRIAHVVETFVCPKHGEIEVFLKFGPEYSSTDRRDLYLSLDHENWVPKAEGLRCPQCGQPLTWSGPLSSLSPKRTGH